jgi:hypothetical protein
VNRHTANTITDEALDALYDELDALRVPGADGAPTVPLYRWQDERRRRVIAERELAGVRAELARRRNHR